MSRKALFFDIDGTLLSEVTRTVPESAVRALKRARESGHLVFINSGRPYCLIEGIKSVVEADGYLCGCGTRITEGEKVLYSASIPRDQARQIKESIVSFGLDGVLEGTEACYFRKEKSRISRVEILRKYVEESGHLSPYGWDEDCYDFDKFCVEADELSDAPGFIRSLGLDFDVIRRGEQSYECVPYGHSKATAIEFILKKHRIPLSDAYVFGDSTNDLSMFEYAENAVLMGHHDRELEEYATFFTKNVEEDGIEFAMKKLRII